MRTKALVLLLAVFWTFPLWCHAQEGKVLTLNQCIDIALEKNPLVLSASEYYKASLARISRAKALPQPTFGYSSDFQPSLFNFGDALESYTGFTFGIPFPTKVFTSGDIAGKESEAYLAETEIVHLEVVFRVKEGFYGLLLAQEQLGYAENNLELAEDFAQKTELQYEAGEVAKVEALRARVEASGATNAVRTARNDVRVARALLNFYLARKQFEALEVQGELKPPSMELDLDALRRTALAQRPEIVAMQAALEGQQLTKKLAVQSYIPDLELGISRHKVESFPTTWEVTFALPVPIFFWQPKNGEIAEAQANIRALERESENLQNAIALEIEQAYRDAVTASNQIDLFETEILTQAEEVYNMFFFSYQEGEIGGIELIAARRTLMEARKSYADALYGYALALAALQKAVGQK